MVLFQSPYLKKNLPFEFLSLNTSVGELKSSQSAVLLGVILDQHLTWHQNLEKNIRSSEKISFQIVNYAKRMGYFPDSKVFRLLYTSVVESRLFYCCLAWAEVAFKKTLLDKLESTQFIIAKCITRCYRNSPIKLILLFSGIYPASFYLKYLVAKKYFQVKQIRDRYKLRVSRTVGVQLPVISAIIRSVQYFGISYRSVVERRVFDFDGIHPSLRKEIETVLDFNSTNEFGVYEKCDLHIFTDGSKDDKENTGCGFAVFKGSDLVVPVLRVIIHLPRHASVYQAELVAIREALMVCIEKWASTCKKVCFHIDNKPAIMTSAAPTSKTSPLSFENYKLMIQSPFEVRLCHIAAHKGYLGNEMADQLAKDGAANSPSSSNHDLEIINLPDIDISMGTVRGIIKKKLDQQLALKWSSIISSETTLKFIPSFQHAKNVEDFHCDKPHLKRYLIWFLTGCCPLNHYLFRLKLKASPKCDGCGCEDEDRNHFLNVCPVYDVHRSALIRKHWEVLQRWPGSTFQWWLEDKRNITILLDYIIITKRFERRCSEDDDC